MANMKVIKYFSGRSKFIGFHPTLIRERPLFIIKFILWVNRRVRIEHLGLVQQLFATASSRQSWSLSLAIVVETSDEKSNDSCDGNNSQPFSCWHLHLHLSPEYTATYARRQVHQLFPLPSAVVHSSLSSSSPSII